MAQRAPGAYTLVCTSSCCGMLDDCLCKSCQGCLGPGAWRLFLDEGSGPQVEQQGKQENSKNPTRTPKNPTRKLQNSKNTTRGNSPGALAKHALTCNIPCKILRYYKNPCWCCGPSLLDLLGRLVGIFGFLVGVLREGRFSRRSPGPTFIDCPAKTRLNSSELF